MNSLQLPVEMDVLNAANSKAQATATELFLKTAVNAPKNQGYFDDMNKNLNALFDAIIIKNHDESQQKCLHFLTNFYKPIEQKVVSGAFTRPGGHQAFKEEVEKIEIDYNRLSNSEKGPYSQDALLMFRKDKVQWNVLNLI
jgi:hypothetical protein